MKRFIMVVLAMAAVTLVASPALAECCSKKADAKSETSSKDKDADAKKSEAQKAKADEAKK
ncbi:MAG: hypothetical protein LBW77_00895 [Verrucomicrobiota bacterium]|jgi:Ni/Co efflux regulator RcnB|nr:hypothetical protein [Verrucomicrobiota bacterium]